MPAAMVGKGMMDRANQIVLVRTFGMHGQKFANLDAWHIRTNGIELTSMRIRSIGFHIVGLHVRRTAGEPDKDY
jgi:hypothetical protein